MRLPKNYNIATDCLDKHLSSQNADREAIIFVRQKALPKTRNGKIRRNALR